MNPLPANERRILIGLYMASAVMIILAFVGLVAIAKTVVGWLT